MAANTSEKPHVVCRAITSRERASIPAYVVSDYYSEVGDHTVGVRHKAAYHQHAVGHYLGSASWDKNNTLVSYHALKGYEAAIGAYLLSPQDFEHQLIVKMKQQTEGQKMSLIEGLMIPKSALHSTKVSFSLDIVYTPNLAQETQERSPQLRFYLSSDNARGVEIIKDLDSSVTTKILEKPMSFDFIRSSVSYDCMLNIDAYAQHRNERGVWCTNQAGYANCSLLGLLAVEQIVLELNVVNSNQSDANKGTIVLKLRDDQSLRAHVSEEDLARGDPTAQIKHDMDQRELVVKDYIETNRALYKALPATISSTRNITVFVDQCRKGYAPGSMFDVFRPPKAHDEYFLNCLQLGVQRMLRSSAKIDLNAFFLSGKTPFSMETTAVMWMLCVYVTNCAYIMDEVDHNKRKSGSSWSKGNLEFIESFGDAEAGDTGDCEDFSRVILKHVAALKYHRQRHSNTKGAEIINYVTDILNRFVFCAVLCGVTSASIDFSKTEGDKGRDLKLQGHEAAFAIPKHIWFTAISRYDADHPVMAFRDLSMENQSDVIYPLEGTGVLNPLPREKTMEEQQYQSTVQVGNLRTEYTYHPMSTTNFYKVMRTLMTEEFFMQGCPYSEFAVYTTINSLRRAPQRRCGVWFHHLLKINKEPGIGLAPCPRLTPQVIESYAYVTKDDYPIHGFCAMVKDPMPSDTIRICNQLNQDPSPMILTDDDWLMQNYYISLDEMDPTILSNLLVIKQSTNSKIRCHMELVRQNPDGHVVGCYVVTLFRSK